MGNIQDAISELSTRFGDSLSTAPSVRDLHGQNETYFAAMPPDAVLFPESTAEVSDAVKICAKHGCPIVPGGVGTSL
ncbi:MAG: FAD-binding protein, partial [Pseudomonadota bacterium]